MKMKMLTRLSSIQFGITEMREFLDTHPDNQEALELYNKYQEKFSLLKKEFEEKYGPLSLDGKNSDIWLKDPWPWDCDFNDCCEIR